MTSLQSLAHGRKTILIAHRLHTVQFVDMLLVLDKGAVVERGTHCELYNSIIYLR